MLKNLNSDDNTLFKTGIPEKQNMQEYVTVRKYVKKCLQVV
jgi:hypothetical protein